MRLLLRLVVLAAIVVAGIAGWYFFIRDDAPSKVALSNTATTLAGGPATVTGTWKVQPGAATFVGYRVTEKLASLPSRSDAVGRTPDVTGSVVIAGTTVSKADVDADLSGLKSNESRRDNRARQALETDRFPKATFHLTEPVALTQAPTKGTKVQLTAKGTLTLHGQTKPVQVALSARWNGPTLDVTGSTPVTFSDYGVSAPNIGGFVTVDDHGTMELSLTLVPA